MDIALKVSTKPLSTTEMNSRASAFVAKWKFESREHAEAQTWWNEFFAIFGVDRYSTAVFERWAKRASTGHQGRIDVFMPGVMIAEHKSLGKDGGKAEIQAEDYLAGGDISAAEMPRYIVSTDFAEVQITDLASPVDPPFRFPITKLPKYIARFAFLSGYQAPVRAITEQTAVSITAARQMGKLYDALLGDIDASGEGHDAEQAAIFMTRILFLLYGDDADGLWEPDAFRNFIEYATVVDGSDTGAQIAVLFQILDTPIGKRSARIDDHLRVFPYVNGGLFSERVDIPSFDHAMRDALIAAGNFEWADVSPAIFGSLFQGMSSRAKRREQGEHYTTEINILKTLRPLFLDELEVSLQAAWPSISALTALHQSLADYRYLDPACGSGNFLIVAYREMRDLELRLLVRLQELRRLAPLDKIKRLGDYALDGTADLNVVPDQFAGIEINWWPSKIAETAMFLVDHQANQRMASTLGSAPNRLPITVAANIVHANALEVDWNRAVEATDSTLVFGNPPFIGQYTKTDDQTADMKVAWGKNYDGYLDFVTAWHAKALTYLKDTDRAAFAFVTTNSITQGQPVPALFKPIFGDGWRISFAHRTFNWRTEATGGAAVHCVIVGFDKGTEKPRLFDYAKPSSEPVEMPVARINPYLLDGPDQFVFKRMKPLAALPEVKKGSAPTDGGSLLISPAEYPDVMADAVAAKYVRPFIGADELINSDDRWCLWLTELDANDIAKSPILYSRLEASRGMRKASKKVSTQKLARTPQLFGEIRQPTVPYICIPRHFSAERLFATVAYFDAEVISGDANFTAEDPDGLLFAVISSTMFLSWQRMVGGRIKSDLRFANTITWNNYPFPQLSNTERERVIAAGTAVLAARVALPGQSLARMYNPLAMSAELLRAHDALDRMIDRAFGFAKVPTTSQRQQRLFDRFLEMNESDQLVNPPKVKKQRALSTSASLV